MQKRKEGSPHKGWKGAVRQRFTPATCPHCEYDRRFPGFEAGGWMQQDNNGPIVSCPMCNDDGDKATRP